MPIYDPNLWKPWELQNNCYDYARDSPSHRRLQPGVLAGRVPVPPEFTNCHSIEAAALADGLTRAASPDECKDPCWPVALVTGPIPWRTAPVQQYDYHWYRRDQNGRWSHKRGRLSVMDTDHAGQPIVDPSTANRSFYQDFCGFFCMCPVRSQGLGGGGARQSPGPQKPVDAGPQTVKLTERVEPMSMIAEPLLFSGIDNPRTPLDRDEEAQLRRLYDRAVRERRPATPPQHGFGYAGVLVSLEGDLDRISASCVARGGRCCRRVHAGWHGVVIRRPVAH